MRRIKSRKGKKGGMLLLLLLILCTMSIPVQAEWVDGEAEYVEIVPEVFENDIQIMSISSSVRPLISISGSTAKVSTSIINESKCQIALTMKLQKKVSTGWSTVKTWSDSKSGTLLLLSKSVSISKGTYRTYAKVTCTQSGKSETKTYCSTSKTY